MYTNLYTKITHGNTLGNSGNTYGNYGNIRGKPYQLKLNDMDCYVNCHIGFGAQISTQVGQPSIIVPKPLLDVFYVQWMLPSEKVSVALC